MTTPLDSGVASSISKGRTRAPTIPKTRKRSESSEVEEKSVKPIGTRVHFSKELDEDNVLIPVHPTPTLRKKSKE